MGRGVALSPPTKGVLACLAAALLWASNGVASKFLMNEGLSPFVLAQGRVTLGAGLALIWLALTRPGWLRIRPGHLPYFALLGGLGLAANNGAYLSAAARIPVAAAVLIQYLSPVAIALYAWRFMGERLGPGKLFALGLAVLGCYLVAGGYNLDLLSLNRLGLLWGLAAMATFSFYCLLSEFGLRAYRPWTVLFYASAFAALAWNLALGPGRLAGLGHDARSWLLVIYSASFGTVIPFGVFNLGLEHLRATRATIVAISEPIFAAVIAFAWLGERLEAWQMLGGAAVLAAVILVHRQRERDELAPAALRRWKLAE